MCTLIIRAWMCACVTIIPTRAQCECDDGGGFDDNMTSRMFSEYCTYVYSTQQLSYEPFNSLQRLVFLQE